MALKRLFWIASSKKDLLSLPAEVQDDFGYSLYLAQLGKKPDEAKPLLGFGGAGVLELVDNHDGDTYRAVYTVRFQEAIFVLHCFQKKSKSGISTPQQDIDLIKTRLKAAEKEYEKWTKNRKT